MPEANPSKAIGLKIASVAAFVAMISLVKETAADVPPGQQVFFRSLFALPVLWLWLTVRGEPLSVLRTGRQGVHFVRGIVGTAAMAMGFAAAGLLPLPEVTALGYTSPLLVVVFAALILRERVSPFRAVMVAVGLIGVLIVLSPRLGGASLGGREGLGVILVLTGAACTALAMIFVKRLVAREHPATVVFWFTATSTTLSLITLPWGWTRTDAVTTVSLILVGLLGGLGQILMTSSYRYGDASLVAPFEYASMLFAVVIGYVAFNEVPTIPTLIGATIVICAGVLIILRERADRRRLRAQSSKPNMT